MKAERLAPLEEKRGQTPQRDQSYEGVINADTGNLKLPGQLAEEERFRLFGLEPITLIIMVFSLAFIVFIAYLISIEPPKPTGESAPTSVEQQP